MTDRQFRYYREDFGKIPVRPAGLEVDLLSFTAHKLGGPKGVGALYVRKGTRLRPLQPGGGQEKGRRGGTEDVSSIAGFAADPFFFQADGTRLFRSSYVVSAPDFAVNEHCLLTRWEDAVGAALKQVIGESGASVSHAVVSIAGQASVLVRTLEVPTRPDADSSQTERALSTATAVRASGVPMPRNRPVWRPCFWACRAWAIPVSISTRSPISACPAWKA